MKKIVVWAVVLLTVLIMFLSNATQDDLSEWNEEKRDMFLNPLGWFFHIYGFWITMSLCAICLVIVFWFNEAERVSSFVCVLAFGCSVYLIIAAISLRDVSFLVRGIVCFMLGYSSVSGKTTKIKAAYEKKIDERDDTVYYYRRFIKDVFLDEGDDCVNNRIKAIEGGVEFKSELIEFDDEAPKVKPR